MKRTGSFINNQMQDSNVDVVPEIGMGVTELCYTDRIPHTIIAIHKAKNGNIKSIEVQEDKAFRTDTNGMSEAQSYRFEPNPEGAIRTLKRYKDGRWRAARAGNVFMLGARSRYYDYSF